MIFKFKYVKVGSVLRPLINVYLSNSNKTVGYPALVDSGADFNVFHSSVAEILSVNIDRSDTVRFLGVGKSQRRLEGKSGIVKVRVLGAGKTYEFEASVVFTRDIPENGYPLLGQMGFFDRFKEISFRQGDGRVILEV